MVAEDGGRHATAVHVRINFGRGKGAEATEIQKALQEGGVDVLWYGFRGNGMMGQVRGDPRWEDDHVQM